MEKGPDGVMKLHVNVHQCVVHGDGIGYEVACSGKVASLAASIRI